MLKHKDYYKLVLEQLKKDDILANFEKINGKLNHTMEINLVDIPQNLKLDYKKNQTKGIYAFGANFKDLYGTVNILIDINKLKVLSPFWMNKEDNKFNIKKEDMKFFLETLLANIEDGKTNFPMFVLYNNKNKLSISPKAINPLDILKK